MLHYGRDASAPFIFAVWDVFWISIGPSGSPMPLYSSMLTYQDYIPFSNSVGSANLVMYSVCRMVGSEGPSVWGTAHWQEHKRKNTSSLQRRLQKETYGRWTGTWKRGKMSPTTANAVDAILCWGIERGEKKRHRWRTSQNAIETATLLGCPYRDNRRSNFITT